MLTGESQIRWPDLVKDLVACMRRAELSRRLNGVTPKQISRWLSGESIPQEDNAKKLLELARSPGVNLSVSNYIGLHSIYDFRNTYDRNVREGPPIRLQSKFDIPLVSSSFLGNPLNSPLGVPSSILTVNSSWISSFAERGFDIITYKTVRTRAYTVHSHPNCVYLPEQTVPINTLSKVPSISLRASYDVPSLAVPHVSIANSFGMPSPSPDEWQVDVRQTLERLKPQQLLIVSVVGTSSEGSDLIEDFVRCARLAAETKPHAIEINCSCPNVYAKDEGSIYQHPDVAGDLVRRIRSELPHAKLLLKISYLRDHELEQLFEATYKYVDGYTAINSVSMKIVSHAQREEPAFTGTRLKAGVSGVAIRSYALETIKALNRFREAKKTSLAILGVGGISTAEHVLEFLQAGADGVQMCTAPMHNPEIAVEIRRTLAGRGYNQPHSSILNLSGRTPKFTDEKCASAFDLLIKICEEREFPVDRGLALLQKNWQEPYYRDLRKINQHELDVRTRRPELTPGEIETWIRNEKDIY